MTSDNKAIETTVVLTQRRARPLLISIIMSSGCLPVILVFTLTVLAPAALIWIATWLFGLSDLQQVAASIIIVGSELAFLFVLGLIVLATPSEEEDADDSPPPATRVPDRRPRRRSN